MSDVLARIRVMEKHGIRRFLYPLDATVRLPATVDTTRLRLLTSGGQAVPFQFIRDSTWEPEEAPNPLRFGGKLSFCLSLAPNEDMTLTLSNNGPLADVADPLQITLDEKGLQSRQKQFFVAVTPQATLAEVVYDGASHLRSSITVTRNGEVPDLHIQTSPRHSPPTAPLHSWVSAQGQYGDGCQAQLTTQLVSSKSMIGMQYSQSRVARDEEIVFTVPLNVTSPTLLCDFGVGGGVYGKIQSGTAEEIVWHTETHMPWMDGGPVAWSIATAGRTDYKGIVEATWQYHPQCWFHLVDADKALAGAVHQIPSTCREMRIAMNINGLVTIAFTSWAFSTSANVSLTYHFLNDVPAIAAATNPQSILLPPTVEVLEA